MRAITLPAHFDGQQIRLDEPFALATDTPLTVTVWHRGTEAEDQDDQFALSAAGLSLAYGGEEPDYSQVALREPNPEYEGR